MTAPRTGKGRRPGHQPPAGALPVAVAVLPVALAWDNRIGYGAVRALLLLWGLGAGEGWVPVSAARMGRLLDVSALTARRAVSELVGAGYVARRLQGAPREGYTYRIASTDAGETAHKHTRDGERTGE